MNYTNFLEARVEELATRFLRNINSEIDSRLRNDIVVYALNRLPAHYVTSGRGVLYAMQDNDMPQSTVDILQTLAEAYEVVVNRRENDLYRETLPALSPGEYRIYPMIAGSIYSAGNFIRIERATVSMFEDGELLPSLSSVFPNPVEVSPHTRGRYAFGFYPKKASRKGTSEITLTLKISAPKHLDYKGYVKFALPSITVEGSIPALESYSLDNIYLSPKGRM